MATLSCTRRRFLAGTLASPLVAAGGYRPSVAAAFYVWTQDFSKRGIKLADGVEEAFASTRRAGYRSVELMSILFQPDIREKTTEALRRHGLALPSVYHGGPMHEALAADKTIGEALALAQLVKPLGTRLQLHHHSPEMAENAREWRHIAHNTDAGLVWFCIDVHWVLRGGQDPMTILREAGTRIASLHLRNSRDGVWLEDFGDGDIDYRAVAAFLRQIAFRGILVGELAYEKETKITRTLEQDLRAGREYTRRVFGA